MKKTTALIALAAAALLPGLLTACSADPTNGSSSTSDTSGSGAGSGAGVSLTECLRGKGYDVPDAGGGSQTLTAPDGVDEEQWNTDLAACTGDGKGAGESGFKPAEPVGSPEQRRKIASCIREHGFADYPDDDDAQATYRADDQQAFQDASNTCLDDVLGGATGGGHE
jgi:hypothetical protein